MRQPRLNVDIVINPIPGSTTALSHSSPFDKRFTLSLLDKFKITMEEVKTSLPDLKSLDGFDLNSLMLLVEILQVTKGPEWFEKTMQSITDIGLLEKPTSSQQEETEQQNTGNTGTTATTADPPPEPATVGNPNETPNTPDPAEVIEPTAPPSADPLTGDADNSGIPDYQEPPGLTTGLGSNNAAAAAAALLFNTIPTSAPPSAGNVDLDALGVSPVPEDPILFGGTTTTVELDAAPISGPLASYGIDTAMPMVVGSFEFSQLLKVTADNDTADAITTTAKMIDLQSILKQARSSAAVGFLQRVAGFDMSSSDGILSPSTNRFSGLAETFISNMDEAKSTLETRITVLQTLESIMSSLDIKRAAIHMVGGSASANADAGSPVKQVIHLYPEYLDIAPGRKSLFTFFHEDLRHSSTSWKNAKNTKLVLQLLNDLRMFTLYGSFNLYRNDDRNQPENGLATVGTRGSKLEDRWNTHKIFFDAITGNGTGTIGGGFFDMLFENQAFGTSKIERMAANLHFVTRDYILFCTRRHQKFTDLYEDVTGSPPAYPESVQSDYRNGKSPSNNTLLRDMIGNVGGRPGSSFSGNRYGPDGALSQRFGSFTQDAAALPILTFDTTTQTRDLSSLPAIVSGKSYFVDPMLTEADTLRLNPAKFENFVTDLATVIDPMSEACIALLGPGINPLINNALFFDIICETLADYLDNVAKVTTISASRTHLASLWLFMASIDDDAFPYTMDMILSRRMYQNNTGTTRRNNYYDARRAFLIEVAAGRAGVSPSYTVASHDYNHGYTSGWFEEGLSDQQGKTSVSGNGWSTSYSISVNHPELFNHPGGRLYIFDEADPNSTKSIAGCIGSGTSTKKIWDVPQQAVDEFQHRVSWDYLGLSAQGTTLSGTGATYDAAHNGYVDYSKYQRTGSGGGSLKASYACRVAVATAIIHSLLKRRFYIKLEVGQSAQTWKYNVLNAIGFHSALSNPTKCGTPEGAQEIIDQVDAAVLSNTTSSGPSTGAVADAESMIAFIGAIRKRLLNQDMAVFNILHYLNDIVKNTETALSTVTSTLTTPATPELATPLSTLITSLRDTPEGAITCRTMTKDQVSLSGAMLYGMRNLSANYPYIPTTQVITQGMVNNMMRFFSSSGFTDPDKKYRILVVGLPAGLLESLRDQTATQTGDSFYSDTTMVRLVVHRRNLVESAATSTLVFPFDTSTHIIEGFIGDPASTPLPTSAGEVRSRTKFNSFSLKKDLSNATGFVSSVISPRQDWSSVQGGPQTQINRAPGPQATVSAMTSNTMADYYLKMYLKLLMGIDLSEGTFMLDPDTSLYSGPDTESSTLFAELMQKARDFSQYTGRTPETQLEFTRLSSEISRSALFNSKRYHNQITGSKIFDRVFCLLIDENDPGFEQGASISTETSSGAVTISSGGTNSQNPDEPTYYQFFVTVDLVKNLEVAGDQIVAGVTTTGEGLEQP